MSEVGWKCGATDTLYLDSETAGYGTPPSSPAWQLANPGGGRLEMTRATFDIDPGTGERTEV